MFEFSREAMLGLPDGGGAANLTDAEFPMDGQLVCLLRLRFDTIVVY